MRSTTAPGTRTRARLRVSISVAFACSIGCRVLGAPWLVFTEIGHQSGDDGRLDFVEIYHSSSPRVDLEGWRLEGAVTYTFLQHVELRPRCCVVIARDVAAFRERHPSVPQVVGPFAGRLGESGGVRLVNRKGATIAAARYGSRAPWPALVRGDGHTLILRDPFFDPLEPDSWAASVRQGGDPGLFTRAPDRFGTEVLIPRESEWRFFRGVREPPEGWTAASFDDSSWERGRGGFGYGDGDDRTVLDDMRGRYLSVFTRREFVLDRGALGPLLLKVDYDDGFVAYINGQEIARASSMGAAGRQVRHDERARVSREAGAVEVFPIPIARTLRGRNVLAVQAHNETATSSDLSLDVQLAVVKPRIASENTTGTGTVVINEVGLRGDEVQWVELLNTLPRPVDLRGFSIGDTPERAPDQRIDPGTRLAPFTRLVLNRGDRGVVLRRDALSIVLCAADARVVDILDAPGPTTGASWGRFPDGGPRVVRFRGSTRGAPNRLDPQHALVINEIGYHPLSGESANEFLEIHNHGTRSIRLDGFRIAGGVRYGFPSGSELAGGGFIVVARDPAGLAAASGLDSRTVVGPLRGRLADRGERITFTDIDGYVIDEVRYADALRGRAGLTATARVSSESTRSSPRRSRRRGVPACRREAARGGKSATRGTFARRESAPMSPSKSSWLRPASACSTTSDWRTNVAPC